MNDINTTTPLATAEDTAATETKLAPYLTTINATFAPSPNGSVQFVQTPADRGEEVE